MTKGEQAAWKSKTKAKFFIGADSEHFHYNAKVVAKTFPEQIRVIRAAFSREVRISATIRKEKGGSRRGLDGKKLNVSVRDALKSADTMGMRFECQDRGGYFVSDGATGGFDFAYIDEDYNTTCYRNLCQGPMRFHDGDVRWHLRTRRSLGIHELAPEHAVYHTPPGVPVREERTSPIILGEIQWANWANLGNDLFEAMAALDAVALDLFVYVVPTGQLQTLPQFGHRELQ
ncbi:MAG: hypothetical protein IPJ78_06065 [Gemmatimonadetes bacterium]|nr:hypothetical protein [Gemmatimonadota bacterium]